jgi:hypothetical protein
VGSRAGLDYVEKRKMCCPYRESNSGRLTSSLSLYQQSYSGSKDNTEIDPIYTGCGVDCGLWTEMTQDMVQLRDLVNTTMNFLVS